MRRHYSETVEATLVESCDVSSADAAEPRTRAGGDGEARPRRPRRDDRRERLLPQRLLLGAPLPLRAGRLRRRRAPARTVEAGDADHPGVGAAADDRAPDVDARAPRAHWLRR